MQLRTPAAESGLLTRGKIEFKKKPGKGRGGTGGGPFGSMKDKLQLYQSFPHGWVEFESFFEVVHRLFEATLPDIDFGEEVVAHQQPRLCVIFGFI